MRAMCLLIILANFAGFAAVASAQELDPQTAEPVAQSFQTLTPITYSGIWGKYVPRVGFRYDTGDSIGRRGGLSSFQGFVPLMENDAATALTFTDSRLLLDSEGANIGANIGLGQRFFLPSIDRTVGGYVYYDNRDTGAATFSQVSGGLESLGDIWDFRVNYYVPTGSDRKLIDATPVGSTPFFAQNFLYFSGGSETWETALAGFDYEAGARLWSVRGMDLRVFGGGYHFQGSGVAQAWGWKTRVEAMIADNVAISLAVQNDRVFDTTVNGGFAFYFPKRSARRWRESRHVDVIDRLAEPVERIQNIVVDRNTTALPDVVAVDPSSGDPLLFLHVADGGNSDGSFEDPYATLTEATSDPRAQAGGTIIYDRRTGTETDNIVVPANNTVLSAGPVQFVQTQFGPTLLPFSGSGANPTIAGSVLLTDNTRLSGFQIVQNNAENALTIIGSNVTVDRTTVSHSGAGTALQLVEASNIRLSDSIVSQTGTGYLLQVSDASGQIDMQSSQLRATGGLGVEIEEGAAAIHVGELSIVGANSGIELFNFSGELQIDQTNIEISSGTFGIFAENGTPRITLQNASINVSTGFSAVAMDTNGGSLVITGDQAVVATNLGPVVPAVDIDANDGTFLLDIESIDADGFLNVGLVIREMGANSQANVGQLTVRSGTGGAVLVDNQGTTTFGLLDLNVDAGDGLVALDAGSVIASNPLNTITVQDGAALLLEGTAVNLLFASIDSGACLDGAINLDGVTGQVTVTGNTTITQPCGPAISIVDSNVNLALGTAPGSMISITDRMDEGIFIDGVSGTLAFANTIIDNGDMSLGTPIEVRDSDASISFARVQISDADNHAVELSNVTGSFAINDGTITGSGGSAVRGADVSNLTLQSLEIMTTGADAIQVVGIDNYTIANNTITDAGGDGIHLEDAQGTGMISGNQFLTVLQAFNDSISVEIVGDADTTIEENVITSALAVSTAINVDIVSGITTTRINDNQVNALLNALDTPILVNAGALGTVDLMIEGNQITSTAGIFVNEGINVTLTGSTADVTITDNVLQNNNLIDALGDGIGVFLNATPTANVTISNNSIIDGTVAEGFDDSILVEMIGGAQGNFTISGNTISQSGFIGEDGIEFGNDGSTANVTVEDNTLNGSTGPGAAGLNMFVIGGGTIAAEITGNTTDTSLDLTNFLSTFGVVDLPNLSANNNGATVNTIGVIDDLP